MSAIQFLTTVAKGVRHTLFQSPEALQQVCEKIVLPNIRLRESDEEIFDMDWVEYVRRDTEGGDADTRRRAASELVKTLTEKFPNEVSPLMSPMRERRPKTVQLSCSSHMVQQSGICVPAWLPRVLAASVCYTMQYA